MKKLFILLFPFLLIFSCKKDNSGPTVNIDGEWIGTFHYDNNVSSDETMDMMINPDGTCSGSNGGGSWTLNGTAFTMSLTTAGVIVNYLGQFDNKVGKLSGTWKNTYNANITGTWSVTKKQP